jgi:hypothetical protein
VITWRANTPPDRGPIRRGGIDNPAERRRRNDCDICAVRTIREQLRKTQKLTREQHLAVAYWGVP